MAARILEAMGDTVVHAKAAHVAIARTADPHRPRRAIDSEATAEIQSRSALAVSMRKFEKAGGDEEIYRPIYIYQFGCRLALKQVECKKMPLEPLDNSNS